MDLTNLKSKDLVTLSCSFCNRDFQRTKRDIVRYENKNFKTYCSAKCYKDSKTKYGNCQNCEAGFQAINSSNKKFCNRSCAAIFNNKKRKVPKQCLFCSKTLKYGKAYCNNTCYSNYKLDLSIKENKASSGGAKKYLLRTKGHFCWKCKNTSWNDFPITLELEHKNGDSSDNRLENLEILCPNCHSQTSTYKAKNIGNGRHNRRKRYKEGKSF